MTIAVILTDRYYVQSTSIHRLSMGSLVDNAADQVEIHPNDSSGAQLDETASRFAGVPSWRKSVGAAVSLAAGLALAIVGQRLLADPKIPGGNLAIKDLAIWMLGLCVLVVLDWMVRRSERSIQSEDPPAQTAHMPSWVQWGLLIVAVSGSWVVWTEVRDRAGAGVHGDIAALWMLSCLVAIIAFGPRPPWINFPRLGSWLRINWKELTGVAVLTGVALYLRVVDLDQFPWVFTADEAKFGMTAREVLDDRLLNPFGTGIDGHPNLFFFLEAGAMHLFGNDVSGSRMFCALLGTLTIPLTYTLTRQHLGKVSGFVAAAITATFHFHLFLSRNAQNNVSAPFFLLLTLILLHRFTTRWRRLDAVLLGMTIGFSQYFYVSNRILVPIAAAYIGLAIISEHRAAIRRFRKFGVAAIDRAALIVAGVVVSTAPLAAYYSQHWPEFWARTNIVSVFASGWLDRQRDITGDGSIAILWGQFTRSALVAFHTNPGGFYWTDVPFVGMPLAIPVALGLAIATVGFWRRRYRGFALAYWVTVVGLAFTEGPPQTNRLSVGASLFPIFAAIGTVAVATICSRLIRIPKALTIGLLGLFVLGTSYWNADFYFDDSKPLERSSDMNTLVANTLGYQLKELGPGYTIYYAAPPRMFYMGHLNIAFLAVGDTGINVDDPWTSSTQPPELTGPTLFFFLPERVEELAIVQQWFPGGIATQYRTDDGRDLYTTYIVRLDS